MARKRDTDELRRSDKVIAVQAINDIPEGARGTVKMVVGQAWTRYMVAWDSGQWMGTVDGSKIVRQDRLDDYRRRQAEEAERATRTAAAPALAEATGDGESAGGGGGGGRVPEHLLERSRQARARSQAAAS
jgi:hypothetical protein